MLLTDFVKLNLVDRAKELMENHDLDNDAFNYLMNKGNSKRMTFKKVEFLYFDQLTKEEQEEVIYFNDYSQEAQEACQFADYFKMGEILYSVDECLRSDNENLLGVWPISNNSALGLIYMNDECAIVTYL